MVWALKHIPIFVNLVSNNTLKYQFDLADNRFEILGGYSFEKRNEKFIY